MRILHLISQRPDSTGSGIYIQQLIKQSTLAGHSNRLICGVPEGDIPELEVIDHADINYLEFGRGQLPEKIVGMSDEMPYPSLLFRDMRPTDIAKYELEFAKQITRVIKEFKPHIIHSHHLWLISSLASRLFPQIPLVTTCHGSDLRQFRTCPGLRARVLSGCQHIRAIFALSEPQKLDIHSLYDIKREKIVVAGGGYNSKRFYQEKKPDPSPVRLLYAGKLSSAKGVPYLLEALMAMKEQDFHLDLIGGGNGPEYNACLTLAEKLANKITLHGSIPQAELAALMKKSHIMILPSLFEGLPLIVLEAVASGCRVITTELPGTREIQKHLPTADITLIPPPALVEVDKIPPAEQLLFIRALQESLTIAISKVSTTPEPDCAIFSAEINHFSWENVFKRCEHIYNEVTQ